MLDQVEAGRRPRLRQLPRRRRRRGAGLLCDLDDDAVRVTRVQERFLPGRIGQVDTDGLDAERLDPGQRALDVGDEEVEVVRAGAPGQEALKESGVGTPGGRQQLDFRARGEFQLAPPEPGRVVAIRPGSAEDAAEQLLAAAESRRADGQVIEDRGHEISRYGLAVASGPRTVMKWEQVLAEGGG